MTERRGVGPVSQDIVTLPSGALLDQNALRAMFGSWDRRAPKRARVERLSESIPELQIEGRPAA